MPNKIINTSLLAIAASAVTGAIVYAVNKITSCGDDDSDVGSQLCVDDSYQNLDGDMQRDRGSQQSFSNNNMPYQPAANSCCYSGTGRRILYTGKTPLCASSYYIWA